MAAVLAIWSKGVALYLKECFPKRFRCKSFKTIEAEMGEEKMGGGTGKINLGNT